MESNPDAAKSDKPHAQFRTVFHYTSNSLFFVECRLFAISTLPMYSMPRIVGHLSSAIYSKLVCYSICKVNIKNSYKRRYRLRSYEICRLPSQHASYLLSSAFNSSAFVHCLLPALETPSAIYFHFKLLTVGDAI